MPHFDMMGLNLGTLDALDTPAAVSSQPNVWKTPHPANQLALLGNHYPYIVDRSLISNNDASLTNALATFETNLTTVVTTLFELNNKEQAKERKEYEDRRKINKQQQIEAETIKEAQRKADNIVREQWHRDDVQ